MKTRTKTKTRQSLILIYCLLLSASTFATKQLNEENSQVTFDYKTKLIQALNPVLQTKYYTIQDGKIAKNEDTIILNAKGTFFSIPDVDITTKFSKETKKVITIKTKFSPKTKLTSRAFKGLTGKSLSQYYPETLYKYFYLKGFEIDYEYNTKDTTNEVKRLEVQMNAGKPWQPFNRLKSLSIQAATGTFIIDNFNTKKEYEGSVAGRMKIGSTTIGVSGIMDKKDYELSADIKKLSITTLVKSTLGATIFQGVSMPKSIFNLAIEQGKMTIVPTQNKLIVNGKTTIGQAEVKIAPLKKKNNEMSYVVGFAPPKSFPFEKIHSSLKPLSKLELDNAAFVMASHKSKFDDLGVFKKLNSTPTIKKGLTFLAAYDLRPSGLNNLLKVNNIIVKSHIPENPQQFMLVGDLDMKIPMSDNLEFKRIQVNILPKDLSVKIGGELGVKVQQEELLFGVKGGVEGKDVVLNMQGYMDGNWENPMGTKGVVLTDVFLQTGISFKTTPIPLPEIAISGNLVVSDFEGDATVAMNANNPLESMLDIGFNKINISDLVEAYTTPKIKKNIPKGIRTKVLNLGLEDARMTLVPAPVVIDEEAYQPGFRVKGETTIMGHTAEMDVEIDYKNGIKGFATMDPIRHGQYFSFTGARGQAKPFVHLVLKATPDAKFEISGKATVLGLSAETYIHLHNKGFDMEMNGKIFNAFKAQLAVSGGDLQQGGNFRVKATLQQNFMSYFTDKASNAIDKATKNTQKGISTARKALTGAQNKLKVIDKEIHAMRKVIKAERAEKDRKAAALEKKLKAAKSKLNGINKSIAKVDAKIAKHKRNIANKNKWIKAGKNKAARALRATKSSVYLSGQTAAIAGQESIKKGLQGTKLTAKAGVDAARLAVFTFKKGRDVRPIDADPRMIAIHAKQKIPYATIESAKWVLKGGEVVSVDTLTAAKWIVDNGSKNIINITYASFEGKLSGVDGGAVSLHIKGTYMNKPIDKKVAFNFNSPLKSIEKFAKKMTK